MTFKKFIRRMGGSGRNGLGTPVLLMVLLAPQTADVAPLVPFMPGRVETT